jgi:hypothetical protein
LCNGICDSDDEWPKHQYPKKYRSTNTYVHCGFLNTQRISSAASVANPLQRRVRKGLPIMQRKAGTAGTDEKETLRMAKVMKQNAMITTR